MKYTLTITLLAFSLFTDAQNTQKAIKEKATEVANATVSSEWETVVKYTYPKIIQMMGGKEQMISIMVNAMQEQQVKIISAEIGEPGEIYTSGEDNLFCLVPETITIEIPNGKIKSESYLLAVSENKGSRWYFIDTAQLNMDNVQEMLPDYNMELVIPTKKPPVFVND